METESSTLSAERALASGQTLRRLMIEAPPGDSFDIVEENGVLHLFESGLWRLSEEVLPDEATEELETIAVSLWNTCGIILRDESEFITNKKRIPRVVRAAAFRALHLATSKTDSGHMKILRAAFTVAPTCMEANLMQPALEILQISAERLDSLQQSPSPIDQEQLDAITAQYYMVRLRLEFLKERYDIADHLYFKVPMGNRLSNRDIVIETCYNAGTQALTSNMDIGIKWLERAVEQVELAIAKDEMTSGSIGTWNLRSRATLVRAYLASKEGSMRNDIEQQIKNLKMVNSGALPVQVLELEVILQDTKKNSHRFFEVLNSIIESPEQTLRGWDVAIDFARILWDYSCDPKFAMKAYHSILSNLPSNRTNKIETTFLRLTILSVDLAAISDTLQLRCIAAIGKAAQILGDRPDVKLSQDTIQAVAMVMWKRIEQEHKKPSAGCSMKWCLQIIENKIFEVLSEPNRTAVLKKYLLAMPRNCYEDEAKKAIDKLSQTKWAGTDEEILFLQFRRRLQKDLDVGNVIRSFTTMHLPNRTRFLHLCMHEAISRSQSEPLLKCLEQAFYEIIGWKPDKADDSISLADVYLCPILIIYHELERGNYYEEYLILQIRILEWLRELLSFEESGRLGFSVRELEWLAYHSFNLASHLIEKAPLSDGIADHLLEFSYEFLRHIPEPPLAKFPLRFGENFPADMYNIMINLLYVRSVISIRVFHACTGRIDMERNYERLTSITLALCNCAYLQPGALPEHCRKMIYDLTSRAFECSIIMGDWKGFWPSVRQQLTTAVPGARLDFRRRILELILIHKHLMHKSITVTLMQDYVIEMSRFFISFTWENFPRWLRVYFDICMSDEPPKDQLLTENYPTYLSQPLPEINPLKIAERILDQALAFVEDETYLSTPAHQAMHSQTHSGNGQLINTPCEHSKYPNEELEHLATRSFCQALDYFAEGKDKECRRWARKSIKLAECMDNEKGPALVKDLRERLRSCME